jgi:hypothetical protein
MPEGYPAVIVDPDDDMQRQQRAGNGAADSFISSAGSQIRVHKRRINRGDEWEDHGTPKRTPAMIRHGLQEDAALDQGARQERQGAQKCGCNLEPDLQDMPNQPGEPVEQGVRNVKSQRQTAAARPPFSFGKMIDGLLQRITSSLRIPDSTTRNTVKWPFDWRPYLARE